MLVNNAIVLPVTHSQCVNIDQNTAICRRMQKERRLRDAMPIPTKDVVVLVLKSVQNASLLRELKSITTTTINHWISFGFAERAILIFINRKPIHSGLFHF